ncbi:uncharacterized protein N7446_005246 [Penicillium canescens]|uniref:uncharacterized protein n=1 Tax=Penicillium canescens TaxID=5083 RepID=UPI0026E03449|nr:uncharacterized protein N7446_005246 [Penicillium canescens]KAJ6068209.1 hypothetical protein N7446_005246 [Penicillium canescens]
MKDCHYLTPVSYAAAGGHETIVKLLLENGKVDVGYAEFKGRTPLSYAAAGGHETEVQLLGGSGNAVD